MNFIPPPISPAVSLFPIPYSPSRPSTSLCCSSPASSSTIKLNLTCFDVIWSIQFSSKLVNVDWLVLSQHSICLNVCGSRHVEPVVILTVWSLVQSPGPRVRWSFSDVCWCRKMRFWHFLTWKRGICWICASANRTWLIAVKGGHHRIAYAHAFSV